MSVWSDGYVSDINYTYGYYAELDPQRAVLPLLMAGLAVPPVRTACELGFGQGLSINVHGAAGPAGWWGTDFNPAHTSFAQELATQSGGQLHLVDQAFSEFCAREDLPGFDFIGLHGIWSWVSDDNRRILVDFIRRKLNVGGVLYISYNTLPGWSAAAPIRHVMAEHAHVMSAPGQGMVQRVKDSVHFTRELLKLSHSYQRQVPSILERVEQVSGQNPHYLAQEYFNRDWHPVYFSEMQDWLEPAKVSFACSANYLDDFAPCLLDEQQQAFLAAIPDAAFAQTAKDYLLNKQFRTDYWVKGARRISSVQAEKAWNALRFMLISRRDAVQPSIRRQREVNLVPEIYQPVLDLLADHEVHAVAQLAEGLAGSGITRAQLHEVLTILHATGDLVLVQDADSIAQARPRCEALNRHLLQLNRVNGDIRHLVSPVSGGAVACDRIAQLFVLAYTEGLREPAQWAGFAWEALQMQGQCLVHEGKTLETEADNLAELQRLADAFASHKLAIFRRLELLGD